MKINFKNIQLVVATEINLHNLKESIKAIFDDYTEAKEYAEKLNMDYYISVEAKSGADLSSQYNTVDLATFLDNLSENINRN